jgi:uncharacterized membrane protein YbaN (DUF454 family)
METETHSDTRSFDNVSTKLIAAGVIVVCLLLGFAGLILPLLPGLLFLAIAAIVAAKFSPRFAEMLRRNDTLRGYMDRTEGFSELPLDQKLKLAGLLFVKATIDGVALLVAGVMKVLKAAERV